MNELQKLLVPVADCLKAELEASSEIIIIVEGLVSRLQHEARKNADFDWVPSDQLLEQFTDLLTYNQYGLWIEPYEYDPHYEKGKFLVVSCDTVSNLQPVKLQSRYRNMKNVSVSAVMAKVILLAAKFREDSYDKIAADLATAESQKRNAEGDQYSAFVDYASFYRLSFRDACKVACEQTEGAEVELSELVYYLMCNSWNDALDWADTIQWSDCVKAELAKD